jgi:tRNA A37 methylthiotransferase MiaB
MKRPAAPEKVLDRVRAWRAERPDITLRSTFIVGFPGETDAEFDELLSSCTRRSSTASAASPTRRLKGQPPTRCPIQSPSA